MNRNTAHLQNIDAWRIDEVAAYDIPINFVPATVLDIGANIGVFSMAAHQRWPEAQILAFEPMPANADRFLALNKDPQFEFRLAAVRDFSGPAEIHLGDNDCTNGFHQLGRQQPQTVKVNCVSAKFLPSCEFVKIDTEGCEVEIVAALDLSQTKAIVVEYHRNTDAKDLCEIVTHAGFQLYVTDVRGKDWGYLKFARPGCLRNDEARMTNGAGDVASPSVIRHSPLSPEGEPLQPKRKVYLAIAGHYASNDQIFVSSLAAALTRPQISTTVGFNADPSVERARNELVRCFLESDATHILFVDSDIGFNAQDIATIVNRGELVVGGMYPLKLESEAVQWCGNGLPENPPPQANGLQRVAFMGTGFLCLAREVFDTIREAIGPEIEFECDPNQAGATGSRKQYAYFRQGVRADFAGKRRFLTEDWMFCMDCFALGIPVFADTHVILKHAGRAVWPLKSQKGNPFQNAECGMRNEEPAAGAAENSTLRTPHSALREEAVA